MTRDELAPELAAPIGEDPEIDAFVAGLPPMSEPAIVNAIRWFVLERRAARAEIATHDRIAEGQREFNLGVRALLPPARDPMPLDYPRS